MAELDDIEKIFGIYSELAEMERIFLPKKFIIEEFKIIDYTFKEFKIIHVKRLICNLKNSKSRIYSLKFK